MGQIALFATEPYLGRLRIWIVRGLHIPAPWRQGVAASYLCNGSVFFEHLVLFDEIFDYLLLLAVRWASQTH